MNGAAACTAASPVTGAAFDPLPPPFDERSTIFALAGGVIWMSLEGTLPYEMLVTSSASTGAEEPCA